MGTRRYQLTSVCLIIAATLLTIISGCQRPVDPWGGTTKPRVLTSIAPLHCFAASIAEPDCEVRCLLTTKGPHDFQPSPHDAKLLSGANLFVVNGLGLEDFLDSLIRSSGNRQLKVLKAGEHIPKDRLIEASGVPHYHGEKLVVHRGIDPHVWLGIAEARKQVEAIRDALIDLDPTHTDNYRQRADKYLKELQDLQDRNQTMPDLAGGLVTFHDSFRYFGRSFHIPIAGAIRGLKGEEIAAAELLAQKKEFREKGVRLIGVEPQYSRQIADNLARNLKAEGSDVQVIELDPLETGPVVPGRDFYVEPTWYLKRMAENVQHVRTAAESLKR